MALTKIISNRRNIIRYFRWSVKAGFLVFFVFPLVYLAAAPDHFVYSYFLGGLGQPLFALPYGQSVCVTWTIAYSQIGPGAWLICPIGGLQTLLTSQAAASYILPTLVALLLFLLPIFILGNVFCSWACPVGTLVDSFDKVVSKWLPKIDAKRQQRLLQEKEKRKIKSSSAQSGSVVNLLGACPNCFVGKVFGDKHVNLANGVLVFSLIGSAIFRFPIFCTLCPIGVVTRGMFHLKAWTFFTNTMMPIILELTIIPLAAILMSLRQKRYWCRKICPVGATLNIAGSASPFFKPNIRTDQCNAKKNIEPKDESSLNQNRICLQVNCQQCESICPQGINLNDNDSMVKCTKCLDCYIACPKRVITLKTINTPDAFIWLKKVLKRKPKQQ